MLHNMQIQLVIVLKKMGSTTVKTTVMMHPQSKFIY